MIIDKNNPAIFSKPYTITHDDTDGREFLSLGNLTRIMQDITEAHMHQIGMDYKVLKTKGWLWVIVWNSIWIDRLPRLNEEVTLYTWCGAEKLGMFSRRYVMESADGTILLTASSMFAMMDEKDRKLVESGELGFSFPVTSLEGEPKMPKVMMKFPALNKTQKHSVLNSEIDKNDHVNNAFYLDWADDLLLAEYGNYPNLKFAWVEYDAELLLGQTADLAYTITENELYLHGTNAGVDSFKIKLEF